MCVNFVFVNVCEQGQILCFHTASLTL